MPKLLHMVEECLDSHYLYSAKEKEFLRATKRKLNAGDPLDPDEAERLVECFERL